MFTSNSTPTRRRHKFPAQYELLAEVPINLSVDLRMLTASGRTDAGQLTALASFTYDDKLERTIVERWEEGQSRAIATASNTGKGGGTGEGRRQQRDEQRIRTITDALEGVSLRGTRLATDEEDSRLAKRVISPLPVTTTNDSSPTDLSAAKASPPAPPSYSQLTSVISRPLTSLSTLSNTLPTSAASADEVASLYLPDETDERREHFARVWRETRSLGPPPPTDIEVLRAFFTFEGDVDKAICHLRPYMALKELGFPEEDICTTLLLYNNNQEEALEHLIRGGPK